LAKKISPKILLTTILFFIALNTLGQNFEIETTKISGIKESIVTDIEQDVNDFIWISSNSSIYKYNNKKLVNYSKKELNLKTHQSTIKIESDINGNIWYYPLVNFSLQILNTKENKKYSLKEYLPNLPFSESEIINTIYRDENHNIYISVKDKGLYKFDGKKITLAKAIKEKNNFPIYFTSSKQYNWYGYNHKIIRENKESLSEKKFTTKNKILAIDIFNDNVFFIQKIENYDEVFFGEYISNNKIKRILPNFKLHSNYITENKIFQKINNNKYWINEKEYLKQIDKNKKVIFQIKKADLPFGNRYRGFFVDSNNIIWILTQTSLYKIVIQKNHFKKYLKGYSLKSIFKRDSTYYISAFSNSLKELNSENKVSQSKVLTKPYSFFGTIYNKDTLWAARYSRALRYNFKTKTTTDYKRGQKIDNEEVGFGVMVRHPKTKTIFIGSIEYLNKIDEKSKSTIVANNLNAYLKKEDSNKINVRAFTTYGDSLWIGTSKGLFLMDDKEKISRAITPENGLPENLIIQYIYIENDTTFWLGTRGQGLIRWNRTKNTFKTYTTKDGLSNNNIYSIYKDKFGFFWLPTDNGLNRFAPKTLKNNIFLPNLISHKEFNYLSSFQDKDGTLLLGGLDGVNVFNPKDFLTLDTKKYNLVLDNVKTKYDDNSIKETTQIKKNKLIIKSNVKSTELDFLLLDFKNIPPLQYQYKITPLQNNFTVADNNKIILPKLKNGEYQLHVKAQSSDGTWAELKKPINIISNVTNHIFYKIIFICFTITASILTYFFIKKEKRKEEKEIKTKSESESAIKIKTARKPIVAEIEKPIEKNKIDILYTAKQTEWLEEFKQTVLQNMNSINFGMLFLSQEMNLSERQLQRRIKTLTNLTPNKYITEIKLNEALRLIEAKEVETIKELSMKVGFTTPDYFSKLFKNKFGKMPSDFLKF